MLCFIKVLCILFLIQKCKSARILAVFPAPSYSHHEVFRPFTEELLKLGHQVVVITPYPAYKKENIPKNLTEIDVGEVSTRLRTYVFDRFKEAHDLFEKQKLCIDIFGHLLMQQMETEGVKKLIKDKTQHFDLIIAEAHTRIPLVFSHVYNAPVVQISSFGAAAGTFEPVGAVTHPILFPTETTQKFRKLTYWEKLVEYFKHYKLMKEYYAAEENENKMLKNYFGPDTPDLSELMKNVAVVFLNIHPLWDFNRPVPPNVVYLGAYSPEPSGVLPKNLQTYLDDSKNGAIYVSFGTNIDEAVLTQEKFKMTLKVFSELPYNFLIKWDREVEDVPKNILMSKWFPQVNILNHPKTKLFITHGGIHSAYEAIAAKVPMIGIPMIFDQWINVEKFVEFKIGEKLDISGANENIVRDTIKRVLKDDSYRNNVVKLRRLIFDQPQKPMERAIWWTEFVLRHGKDTNMRSPSANMNWVEYYEIELVCLVILSISTVALLTLKCLRLFVKFLFVEKKKLD